VEAVEHRHALVASRLAAQAGELDCRLVRFGAAVAEEALPIDAAALDQRLCKQPLRLHVPGVRYVDQLGNLVLHGLDDARRAMADQVAAPAGEEIEIALPLGVPDVRPFAADQANRISA